VHRARRARSLGRTCSWCTSLGNCVSDDVDVTRDEAAGRVEYHDERVAVLLQAGMTWVTQGTLPSLYVILWESDSGLCTDATDQRGCSWRRGTSHDLNRTLRSR
jgi:hypothetical protein